MEDYTSKILKETLIVIRNIEKKTSVKNPQKKENYESKKRLLLQKKQNIYFEMYYGSMDGRVGISIFLC